MTFPPVSTSKNFTIMCYRPIHLTSVYRQNGYCAHDVPCGKCAECQASRIDSYFLKCNYEYSACDKRAHFITFTYDDAHLPKAKVCPFLPVYESSWCNVDMTETPLIEGVPNDNISCWDKRQVQNYLKKLNERCQYYLISELEGIPRLVTSKGHRIVNPEYTLRLKEVGRPFRYLITCERGHSDIYTDRTGKKRRGTSRPHLHGIFFIRDARLEDKFIFLVKELWTNGFIYDESIDRTFDKSIYYICKYVNKQFDTEKLLQKVNRGGVWENYQFFTREDELNQLPFTLSSKYFGYSFYDYFNSLTEDEKLDVLEKGVSAPLHSRKVSLPLNFRNAITKDVVYEETRKHNLYTHFDFSTSPLLISIVESYVSPSSTTTLNELGKKLEVRNRLKSVTKSMESINFYLKNCPNKFKEFTPEQLANLDYDDMYLYFLQHRNLDTNPTKLTKKDDFYLFERLYQIAFEYTSEARRLKQILYQTNFKSNLADAYEKKPQLFNKTPI